MRPTKTAIIKITNKMKSVKTGPTGILIIHCWWEYKFIQPINVWHLLSTKVDIHFEHCDPGISLLGTYPVETCTTSPPRNFKVELFITSQNWKQSKHTWYMNCDLSIQWYNCQHENEQSTATCISHVEWRKTDTKEYKLYDSFVTINRKLI